MTVAQGGADKLITNLPEFDAASNKNRIGAIYF
jgi:hypothetical protein